jgi:hypothetical protein
MLPEPTNASQNAPYQQPPYGTTTTSQHGQRRDDDLQDSLQPHSDELWGEPEPPTGGHARGATRSDEAINEDRETNGLKSTAPPSPPPRDRITEYENALANSPRKPSAGGPLFEIIKSNKKPGDKHSPIDKLPNGT